MATKYKTFTDYYYNDDEFRKNHLKKLNEKIECDCGFITARCNLSRHKKSHLHLARIGNGDEIKKLQKRKKQIDKKIEELVKEKSKIDKQLKKMDQK